MYNNSEYQRAFQLYSAIIEDDQDSVRNAERAEAATSPNHSLSQLTWLCLGWAIMHTMQLNAPFIVVTITNHLLSLY